MNPPKYKMCTKCFQNKPADRQHFHYANSTPDGYNYWCRVCRAEHAKTYVPSDKKPRLTEDEIVVIEARMRVAKTKRVALLLRIRMEWAAFHAEYASKGIVLDGVRLGIGIKVCCKCKVQKPATTDFFHRMKKAKDGFSSRCKQCLNRR